MINGLGVVGWGVGGIEAEAGMLGQPVYFLTPDVVGVHLTGALREGVTATDLALHITQMLRKAKGRRQVRRVLRRRRGVAAGGGSRDDREHGAGVRRDDGLLPDRRGVGRIICAPPAAPRSNAPRSRTITGRRDCLGMPRKGEIDYSVDLELDLGDVQPSVAGPKRPQDRIESARA